MNNKQLKDKTISELKDGEYTADGEDCARNENGTIVISHHRKSISFIQRHYADIFFSQYRNEVGDNGR